METVAALLVKMGGLPQEPLERYWSYISGRYGPADRKAFSSALRRTMPDKEEHMISIAAKEWLAEGRAEGRAEGKAETLTRQLEKKFGEIPTRHAERISKASVEQLDGWLDVILDAASIDEVFGPLTH